MQYGDDPRPPQEPEAAQPPAANASGPGVADPAAPAGADPGRGGPAAAAGASGDIARLEADLERATHELERTRGELTGTSARLEEVARAYAGLVNDQRDFRARLEREKARVLETERGKVAAELLEVGDELERALAAASGDEGPLARGVKLIREGLMRRLGAMGIERLQLVGRPFDPNVAEAIDLQPVRDRALDDTVVEEIVPAYRLGERVLRAARVRVARYLEETAAARPTDGGDGSRK